MGNLFHTGLSIKAAILNFVLLAIVISAIATEIYTFHQFQSTMTRITGPKLNLLLSATKLVQQSDTIISSSSTLLLATNQYERRRAVSEISDRDEWMDKLIQKLRSFDSAPSETFFEVIQAKENLLKNLHEIDSLVERRIKLRKLDGNLQSNAGKELTKIREKLNNVLQKNRLYSQELGIILGYYVSRIKEDISKRSAQFEIKMQQRRWYMYSAGILSAMAVLLTALYVHFSIVRRVVNLQHTVADKNVSPSDIEISGHDEISKLAQSIKEFIHKIRQNEHRITSANKDLNFLAHHDPLTNTFNRRHFEKISNELSNSSVHTYSIGIIDIDNFKNVNDSYGHMIGDMALKHLASITKSGIRSSDILARYGGEEFIVMMPETDSDQAQKILERVRILLQASPFYCQKNEIIMTASFGICQRLNEHQSVEDCLHCADKALYHAKRKGKNTVVVYNPNQDIFCES